MTAPDDRRWYHLIFTTYGAWLPGDPRGFRTRHHREHVEGDYRNPPPPGFYEGLQRAARATLKKPPVTIAAPLRPVVGQAVKERLESLGVLVVCAAVLRSHLHLLAKLPPDRRLNVFWRPHSSSPGPPFFFLFSHPPCIRLLFHSRCGGVSSRSNQGK